MGAVARARDVRMAPRKVRAVLDVIRGRPVKEAYSLLRFIPRRASRAVEKVLRSAVANASQNHGLDEEKLVVARAWADPGPVMKRYRAGMRGRAMPVLKRTSHITIEVEERE
jgi:large subunit ribosomal protein L22